MKERLTLLGIAGPNIGERRRRQSVQHLCHKQVNYLCLPPPKKSSAFAPNPSVRAHQGHHHGMIVNTVEMMMMVMTMTTTA